MKETNRKLRTIVWFLFHGLLCGGAVHLGGKPRKRSFQNNGGLLAFGMSGRSMHWSGESPTPPSIFKRTENSFAESFVRFSSDNRFS